MTIESPTELRLLLNNLSSLTDSDRNVMMDTARFLPDGRIASLYIRLMMEKCNAEPKKKGERNPNDRILNLSERP